MPTGREVGARHPHWRFRCELPPPELPIRRIYRVGFTEFTRKVITALGYLPLWGSSKFYFRVRRLPGINPKTPFSPIMDSTAYHSQQGGVALETGRACIRDGYKYIYIYIYGEGPLVAR